MEITEKDIFYYVFYPSELEEDKLRYIDENKDRFPQMSVYREISDSLNREVSPAVKNKLAKKIPAYKLPVVYELFPWTIEAKESKISNSQLAAASKEAVSDSISKTFLDKEKNIIIRLIGTSENSRLYIFSVDGNILGEFGLTINPGNKKFHYKDSREIKTMEDVPEIQSISIELYPE